MKIHCRIGAVLAAALLFVPVARASVMTTNPILFVTQVHMPRENNGAVATSFLSVVSLFGNHLPDTAHCGRGGDLWLRMTNGALVNLTRSAGFGTNGVQDGVGIAVRDPAMHWSGKKALFSMVVGAPASSNDVTQFHWQLYEVTNLTAVIADTNIVPAIIPVPNQPTNFNNVNPTYATDDRVIFMTDKPIAAAAQIYPQLEEYKGQPSVTGTWSLNPATGNLRQLNHTPSGAFNPFVDSFGRVIETRWDHLVQDANSADDRLHNQTNGVFNFLSEALGASNVPVTLETFPEPRNFDTTNRVAMGVNGNAFNNFFPWMLPEAGGEEEIINHLGRHEFAQLMTNSFLADTNLLTFGGLASRTAAGVVSVNTNFIENFFQIVEDPRTNGVYFGVDAPDFSQNGGTHTSGRILTLTGPPSLNPNNMFFTRITAATTINFRNPLPMSDGALIAAATPVSGFDSNLGTASLPKSAYNFRLMLLTNNPSTPIYMTNQFLIDTPLTNVATYWDGTTRVTQSNALWELQPVEVRARPVPSPWNPGVAGIEATVFTNASVDLATFQADLANRGLALVVSRNVTARDGNDKQQPYNLRIPGGTNSIANGGKVYDISHLQFLQADFLRGYTNGQGGLPQPGRRVLATPMHDSAAFNYVSAKVGAPLGGTELMPDGSQATIVPANRAVTWHLTGTNNNDSVVKERYWITFRPGEVRTCANCHGINAGDQLGRPAPTNAPLALQKLLQLWRTNAANAYSLTVSNGTGSGNFGAGSIVTLTANAASSGKLFAGWGGAAVANPSAPTTSFIMPTNSTTVTAIFTNLPSPVIASSTLTSSNTVALAAQAAANQPWVLEASPDLLSWTPVSTNTANGAGSLQLVVPVNAAPAQQFFRLRSP
ncbi:MAG: hypothetical protein RLY20_201 [Verrucomicrobiota bacterium]|jgi:hypothetical protein